MPPLLSISIIAFYLSILIELFLYFQFAKKDSRFENLSSVGILTAFTIGSFLLLNGFALKTLISLLPLVLYGFAIDFGKTTHRFSLEIISLLLGATITYLTVHVSLKSLLLIFTITLILNRIQNNTKFLIPSYTLLLTFLSIMCQNTGNPSLIKTSTILAVSTGALIFVNLGRERMKVGYSLKYSLNFFISALLIELLRQI